MKHWLNPKMLAPNVATVAVDPAIAESFADLLTAPIDPTHFSIVSPPWNSDIEWISANSEPVFRRFERAFHALDIAHHVEPYLDLDRGVRMYGGFLVVRRCCSAPDFHVDWVDSRNEGFNMITPITPALPDFGLQYERLDGVIGDYHYRRGEAIIIGENFSHSTKPASFAAPVATLSFTFGTDRMEHWDALAATAARQAGLVSRPDGQLIACDSKRQPASRLLPIEA